MVVKVNDFLLQRLGEWNIRRIYGYPGDGIKGIMEAMDRAGDSFAAMRAGYGKSARSCPPCRKRSEKTHEILK